MKTKRCPPIVYHENLIDFLTLHRIKNHIKLYKTANDILICIALHWSKDLPIKHKLQVKKTKLEPTNFAFKLN